MFASKRSRVALSLAIAAILLSTTLVVIEHPWSTKPSGSATFGPKIALTLVNGSLFSSSANVTESLQIMGVNPSYLWPGGPSPNGGMNLTAGAYMTLFNDSWFPSQSANRHLNGFLNDNFSKIIAGWKSYYQKEGNSNQSASVVVESTLSVLLNGNLSVYTYYNNMPFNPSGMILERYAQSTNSTLNSWFNGTSVNPSSYSSLYFVPAAFNVTPSFDSAPAYVTEVNNTSAQTMPAVSTYSPDRIIGICNTGTWYIQQWTKTLHGPDPLLTVHINGNYPPENNFLAISEAIGTSSVEMSMNSDQTGVTSGGSVTDQMSTSPSWSATGTFTADGSLAQWSAFPNNYTSGSITTGVNNTTAIIYLTNATFTITHYNIYYIWGNEYNCYQKYLGNTTSVQITAVNSTNGDYNLGYGFISIDLYYVLQNMTKGIPATNLGTLAGGTEIQGGQIWGDTTGYSNGATVIQEASKAMSTFAAGLGIAVAAINLAAALNGADGDASDPVVVDATLGLIDASLGLANTLAMDFASISFSTTSNFGFELYSITNEISKSGYAYNLIDFQSPNPVTFSVNGNNYQFTAPSNFVVAS